jgi:hypothetical protein
MGERNSAGMVAIGMKVTDMKVIDMKVIDVKAIDTLRAKVDESNMIDRFGIRRKPRVRVVMACRCSRYQFFGH